jgi:hypothetical protein
MLLHFRVGREIMLLVFFFEMLRVCPAVSAPPLMPARLLPAITLLLGLAHIYCLVLFFVDCSFYFTGG